MIILVSLYDLYVDVNIEKISNTTYNSYVKFLLANNVIETNQYVKKNEEIGNYQCCVFRFRVSGFGFLNARSFGFWFRFQKYFIY